MPWLEYNWPQDYGNTLLYTKSYIIEGLSISCYESTASNLEKGCKIFFNARKLSSTRVILAVSSKVIDTTSESTADCSKIRLLDQSSE